MDRIIIAGINIPLRERSKTELKGITVLDRMSFQFYDFELQGISMLLLESKGKEKFTPAQFKRYSERLGSLLGLPIVFFFDHLLFYFRKRLIEQGVFFVSGEKNAFLPSIIATPSAKKQLPQKLSACAQYLILRHLQEELDRTVSLVEMTKNTPYSYISIAQAVQNLEALNLCRSVRDAKGIKRISYSATGKKLWEMAKPFLASPVKKRFFCTGLQDYPFPAAGITALSMVSSLAPDQERSVAVYSKEYVPGQFENENSFDGPYIVEIWRYPIIGNKTVDKLSLYLSLENDRDPRVEKELAIMLDAVWKKL